MKTITKVLIGVAVAAGAAYAINRSRLSAAATDIRNAVLSKKWYRQGDSYETTAWIADVQPDGIVLSSNPELANYWVGKFDGGNKIVWTRVEDSAVQVWEGE